MSLPREPLRVLPAGATVCRTGPSTRGECTPWQGAHNNACEHALKMAIRHRRSSLFYRSERGAQTGDMLMSLIYTAELRGENPFEYLTAVLRNYKAAAASPAEWLPWTYRATLASLAECTTVSATPR